jgi:hypothetical protein
MLKMIFEIPHKPDDMTPEIWTALLRRSSGKCERPCERQCDTRLEVDHVHARALGGETSLANCRLVCAQYNRERGAQPDAAWSTLSWFDDRGSFDHLRRMQRAIGPNMVAEYADLFVAKRAELLKYISLFAVVTGGGKTLLMVATLLAINEEVNRRVDHAPRVRRVLWFVNERALGDQLKRELLDEPVRFGLHPVRPSVQVCTETGDIERGPMHHPFTISCPHVLWDKKDQRRDDPEIATILSAYDTIIWDECDFAPDQSGRLARLAPHALKFGLTATPIDGDGDFLRQFALAGKASYDQVFKQDRCLSVLLPWDEAKDNGYVKGIPHSAYHSLDGGVSVRSEGQHGEKASLPGGVTAIRYAMEEMSDLERRMEGKLRDTWYSPHILVRCSNINEARSLKAQIDDEIRGRRFPLHGEGWRTTIMHQGLRGVPEEEKRFFHDRKGVIHPFLRAKQNRGRCDGQSSRILFVVDMGIRGLNNWPVLALVDIARGESINVQVQAAGRPMRLPPHLADIAQSKELSDFATIRYFYPDSGGSPGAMEQAVSFILEMDARFENAGLVQWSDVLEGTTAPAGRGIQAPEQPFTLGDRVQVDAVLGGMMADGVVIDEDAVEEIIRQLPPVMTEGRRERAAEHIERVLNDDRYRASLVDLEDVPHVRPVSQEEPKQVGQHTLDELAQYVLDSRKLEKSRDIILADLREGRPVTILLVSQSKHDEDMRFYRPPIRLFRLQRSNEGPGILTESATALLNDLDKRGVMDRADAGKVYAAVNTAVARICRVDDTSNDGPLDQPAYHHALGLPRTQQAIKETAVKLLILHGVLPDAAAVYVRERGHVA